ncbi:hypothetical protein [Cellulomonas sp. PS-H5]|uniref:hypothetical protein n=1 Tax=Cellulomonas sp. PS-H5 TaxID=2820400 RepID=UPI001C4EB0C0|nr:hypothetical protein [Cellulomonas sp. PS-H5]MBW0253334.1 hypothetical protein [Cellulomonas sp. PS-H5]
MSGGAGLPDAGRTGAPGAEGAGLPDARRTGAPGAGGADAPVRRRPWLSRRHAAVLAAGAGLAVVGLVVLLVVWVGLVTSTLRTGLGEEDTCVAAATAGEDGATVSSSLLPPRAVCTWTVDGRATETVLAERPAALAGAAVGAVGVGVLLVAGGAVAVWRARRRPEVAPAG